MPASRGWLVGTGRQRFGEPGQLPVGAGQCPFDGEQLPSGLFVLGRVGGIRMSGDTVGQFVEGGGDRGQLSSTGGHRSIMTSRGPVGEEGAVPAEGPLRRSGTIDWP